MGIQSWGMVASKPMRSFWWRTVAEALKSAVRACCRPSCGGEAEREEVSVAQEEAGGGLPPFPEEEEEGVPAIVELVPEGLPVLADSEDAGEILVDSL